MVRISQPERISIKMASNPATLILYPVPAFTRLSLNRGMCLSLNPRQLHPIIVQQYEKT